MVSSICANRRHAWTAVLLSTVVALCANTTLAASNVQRDIVVRAETKLSRIPERVKLPPSGSKAEMLVPPKDHRVIIKPYPAPHNVLNRGPEITEISGGKPMGEMFRGGAPVGDKKHPGTDALRGSKNNALDVSRIHVTASQSGLGALVVPGAHNANVIRAQIGKTSLGNARAYTMDLYGDQLVRIVVNDKVLAKMTDVSGRPLAHYVTPPGPLNTQDVLISPATAKAALDNVVSPGRVVGATVFQQSGGHIVLSTQAVNTPLPNIASRVTVAEVARSNVPSSSVRKPVTVKTDLGADVARKPRKLARSKLGDNMQQLCSLTLPCPPKDDKANAVDRGEVELPHDAFAHAGGTGGATGTGGGAGTGGGNGTGGSASDGGRDSASASTLSESLSETTGWTAAGGTARFADLGRKGATGGASADLFANSQPGSFVQGSAPGADEQYFHSSTADYVVIRAARRQRK